MKAEWCNQGQLCFVSPNAEMCGCWIFFLVIVSAMRKYVMGREGGMGNVFVRVRTTSMFAFRLAYVGFVCMIVMSGKERNKH